MIRQSFGGHSVNMTGNNEQNGLQAAPGVTPEQQEWAQRDAGTTWQLNFFRILIQLGGRQAAYHIMYLVVLWYILFNSEIRRRTRYYLDRRFPERKSHGLPAIWDSYRLVCSFGQVLIDQAALIIKKTDIPLAVCLDENELREAAAAQKGAILLVSHVGCWQIAMTAMGFLQKTVCAVMMPQGEDSPLARTIGKRLPVSIIDPRNGMESVVEMLQALRRGEILTIMGDRVFGGEHNRVSAGFLGDDITLPALPYSLAAASGAPILVLHAARIDSRRYEITLARVIETAGKRRRGNKDYSTPARIFTEAMEEFVGKHPWQFFNFFNMWGK